MARLLISAIVLAACPFLAFAQDKKDQKSSDAAIDDIREMSNLQRDKDAVVVEKAIQAWVKDAQSRQGAGVVVSKKTPVSPSPKVVRSLTATAPQSVASPQVSSTLAPQQAKTAVRPREGKKFSPPRSGGYSGSGGRQSPSRFTSRR